MHWVERGSEPDRLEAIRDRYSSYWIDFYENGIGSQPTDSRWRDFREDLGQRFLRNCGYCERNTRGEVDHFRPKSRFPESVYDWKNWIFSCHECNQAKGDKWPTEGYVDPCVESESCRPENYFTFNTKNGAITPLRGLDTDRFEKAQQMIVDIKLNDLHHMVGRLVRLKMLEAGILNHPREETQRSEALRRRFASRDSDLSSLARVWLMERGYAIND